ncbi:uncharacterized protein [Panulirus ornatus]|uniref:uncharacterized protein isoform X2 n=1 Tax=Panulirus ornatus TaxID=150431 RepID=UPI003A8C35D1
MEEELLALRWNNHLSTFATLLSDLRNEETYSDVTIACGGNLYPAHKFVLSACSEYLRTMLCAHPNKHPILYLKDVPKEDLEAILDYMYAGTVRVAHSGLASLLHTAEGLQVKGLILSDHLRAHSSKILQSYSKRKPEDESRNLCSNTSYKHQRRTVQRTLTSPSLQVPSSSATSGPSPERSHLVRSPVRLHARENHGMCDEKSNQDSEAGDNRSTTDSLCYSESNWHHEGRINTHRQKEESLDPKYAKIKEEGEYDAGEEDREMDIKEEVAAREAMEVSDIDIDKVEEEDEFEGFEENERDGAEEPEDTKLFENGDDKDGIQNIDDSLLNAPSLKDPHLASFLEVMCTENDSGDMKENKDGISFGYSSYLFSGQREGSSRVNIQQCPFCQKLLTTRSNLQRHIATHHQRQSFTCATCGKTFTRKDRLTEHEKLHTGEAPYTCEECGKNFSRRDNLNVHRRTHTAVRVLAAGPAHRSPVVVGVLVWEEETRETPSRTPATGNASLSPSFVRFHSCMF